MSHIAARTKSYQHHKHKKYLARGSDKNKLILLPSASDVLREDGVQVTSSSLESIPSSQKHHHHHHHGHAKSFGFIPGLPLAANKRSSTARKKRRTCLPKIAETDPEDLRTAFLNQGTTYWTIVIHASSFLATASFIQLAIYFTVFGLTGHYRIMVALLPVRNSVLVWFLSMHGADFLVMFVIRFGKRMSKQFGMTKTIDTYFIITATIILCVTFIASMGFPVYATPNLLASVDGTVEQNSTLCLEPRNSFMEAGTSWSSIPVLEEICKKHILCIDPCRDFRTLYFWIYGTYIVAVVRLFVLITLWNIVAFLSGILNLREEIIEYKLKFNTV